MELYTDILFRLHEQVVFVVEGGGGVTKLVKIYKESNY